MKHRNDRNTHIDLASRDTQFDTTVLRHAFLCDIHLGHDLQPADDRRAELIHLSWSRLFLQHTIDAMAYLQARFLRLDVDIAGASFDRLADDLVDQSHHGRLLGFFSVFQTVWIDPLKHLHIAGLTLQGNQTVDGFRTDPKMPLDQPLNGFWRSHHRPHFDFQS